VISTKVLAGGLAPPLKTPHSMQTESRSLAMTMLPLSGIVSSAAGAPLSQTAGSETERAQKVSLTQGRLVDAQTMAEQASGIGQTNEDQETSERDADGRRPWEFPAKRGNAATEGEPVESADRQSKDATGECGNQLDLTG
jgi:hypothetical protein